MREDIRKVLIEKADIKNPVLNYELLDIDGNFEKGKHFLGAIGGHLQQLYFVVDTIMTEYEADMQAFYARQQADPADEANRKAMNPRELMQERFFLPYLCTYLKEMKVEHLTFMANPELVAALEAAKIPYNAQTNSYDVAKLGTQPEAYIAFRSAFVEERMFNPIYLKCKNQEAIEMILSALCMVMCKKVPADVATVKPEPLATKIRIIQAPKGLEQRDRTIMEKQADGTEKEVTIAKNTNEKALVRILIPKKKITKSEIAEEQQQQNATPEGGEPVPEGEQQQNAPSRASALSNHDDRMIEVDQDERGVSVMGRSAQLPYAVFIVNHYAQREHRHDFLHHVCRNYPEYFSENPKKMRELEQALDRSADLFEEAFISEHCSEYELPCLDYIVNAHEYE